MDYCKNYNRDDNNFSLDNLQFTIIEMVLPLFNFFNPTNIGPSLTRWQIPVQIIVIHNIIAFVKFFNAVDKSLCIEIKK